MTMRDKGKYHQNMGGQCLEWRRQIIRDKATVHYWSGSLSPAPSISMLTCPCCPCSCAPVLTALVTSCLHSGQIFFMGSHLSTHSQWNSWPHGRHRTSSFSL